MSNELSEEGRMQVATALLLLKDWKCEGKFNPEVTVMILKLAEHLGVLKEYEKVLPIMPIMRVEPRFPA